MTAVEHQPGPSETVIAAEENVLSAIMVSETAIELIVQTGLEPGDFYRDSHARIYRAALSLHQLGSPVDGLTIARRLEESGALHDVGGRDRLRDIAVLTTPTARGVAYAQLVIRDARRRDYQTFGEQLAQAARADTPLTDLEAQARQFLDVLDKLADPAAAAAPVFEPLREFLKRQLPKSESLVGVPRDGTNLLPRYGWVMPWGREGSAKTSVLVDLLFHAAAGRNWTGYQTARPMRFVAIVNEGIPGGFQDKLEQKTRVWDGPLDPILDNIAVYASPWGEFTFRNRTITRHARDYAIDFGADYVALDPLHTLGTTGAGTPQETEEFKHMLRRFGLWDDLGVITAHHANKSGMVSGDWARHPDTVIRLEKDGKNPATRYTLEKARPADPAELGVPSLLEWETATLGYRRVRLDAPEHLSDDDLLERIRDAVTEAARTGPGHITLTDLKATVKGDSKRIAKLARGEVDAGRLTNRALREDWLWLAPGATSPGSPSQPAQNEQTRIDTDERLGDEPAPSHTQSVHAPERDDEWVGDPVTLEGSPTHSLSHSTHDTNGSGDRLADARTWIITSGYLEPDPLTAIVARYPTLGVSDYAQLERLARQTAADHRDPAQ